MSKKVVSFSLWGDRDIYWKGALENIKLVKKMLPDWTIHFYIDNSCKKELIDSLKGDIVECRLIDNQILGNTYNFNSIHSHQGMFWRFLSSVENDVELFISRDCDSRISNREILAIKQWTESDKSFHIMRDHPYHASPILGGTWGCRGDIMKRINLIDKIIDWTNRKIQSYQLGVDQDFLNQVIYPVIKNEAFEHSEFGINYGNTIHTFPSERIDYEFVGDVFDENNNRHPEYWKIIKSNCEFQKK
jgi:hypothetical protein